MSASNIHTQADADVKRRYLTLRALSARLVLLLLSQRQAAERLATLGTLCHTAVSALAKELAKAAASAAYAGTSYSSDV